MLESLGAEHLERLLEEEIELGRYQPKSKAAELELELYEAVRREFYFGQDRERYAPVRGLGILFPCTPEELISQWARELPKLRQGYPVQVWGTKSLAGFLKVALEKYNLNGAVGEELSSYAEEATSRYRLDRKDSAVIRRAVKGSVSLGRTRQ